MSPSAKPMRIGIVAGEMSGDILGEGLMKAILKDYPDAQFVGIGGPRMKALGCESLFDMEELAVMGLVEVLGRLPRLLKVRKSLVQYFKDNPPDVFVGVDAPDFNLRVELPLKEAGIKTVHYVSPSVWAWRQKRIHKIAKATNMVLSLLPFEKAFYDEHNVPCTFVGHTLADDIPVEQDSLEARQKLGLNAQDKVLALLPGSRGSEVGLLTPTYAQAAQKLQQQDPNLKVVVPLVNEARRAQFVELQQAHAPELKATLLDGQSSLAMQASDAILLASGTASLEGMLYKKPMVVGYKLKPMTYWMVQNVFTFTIKYFSLPNLLADEALVPEFLQDDCNVDTLCEALHTRLYDDQSALIARFTQIHKDIRCDASRQAADAVLEIINAN